MNTIELKLQRATGSWGDTPPEGVTTTDQSGFDEHGKWFFWEEWTIPSLGDPLYLSGIPKKGIVLDFGGRRWRVARHVPDWRLEEGFPGARGAVLVFTPTDDPITESTGRPPEPGKILWGAQVYGQPHFRQGRCFPVHEGKAAFLLWSQETPWVGDCGQENVFLALDKEGLPLKVWIEWSCC